MVESGRARGIVVWNLSRFTRSLADGVAALARIEGAGGRLYSATEQFGDDAGGRMYRNILPHLPGLRKARGEPPTVWKY
jgi:DNA invertase Pin-like site-specific DNA recombinase